MRFIRVILPVSGIAFLLFFGCGRDSGEQLYRQAVQQIEEGNPVRARSLLEKSIRRRAGHPENAYALNRLGILLFENNEFIKAAEVFEEAVRVAPGQVVPLVHLGMALAGAGEAARAEEVLREAVLLRPDDPRPLARAGIAYALQGEWMDAQRTLRHAYPARQDEPSVNNALALIELHTQGAEAALQRLRAMTDRHPDYAPAWVNLAAIYWHMRQDRDEALRSLRTAMDRCDAGSALRAIARQQMETWVPEAETVASVGRGEQTAEALFRQAFARQREGALDEAIALYRRALDADERYEQAWNHLGLAYYTQGRMEEATSAFRRAVELNPAFTGARYNYALALLRQDQTELARRELQEILRIQPDHRPARILLEQIEAARHSG